VSACAVTIPTGDGGEGGMPVEAGEAGGD
jgi:hypothetical protein